MNRVLSGGLTIVAACTLAIALSPPNARGSDAPRFGHDDVATVFYIAKSENRNRVDFGVKLDGNCQPRGDEPVFPYWRMLEESPVTLEGLSTGEPRAYGIGRQYVHDRSRAGSWVHVELRALSSRPIGVLTLRNSSGRCDAAARMTIRGQESHLHHVFVQLGGGLIPRPDWIQLVGRTVRDDRPVRERIDD
jgi:hypothetical protein